MDDHQGRLGPRTCAAPAIQEILHKQTAWTYSRAHAHGPHGGQGPAHGGKSSQPDALPFCGHREQAQRGELFYALKHAFNGALTPMVQCLLDTHDLSAGDLETRIHHQGQEKISQKMNPLIETLNRFGENALHFAWPMLWQSSLLIASYLFADFTLRRRGPRCVRYALWLVLLLKLLLHHSLAAATGVAWWLFPAVTTPARPHVTKFVVKLWSRHCAQPPVATNTCLHSTATTANVGSGMDNLAWSAISVCLLVWLAGAGDRLFAM